MFDERFLSLFDLESLLAPRILIREVEFYLKELVTRIGVRIWLNPYAVTDPFSFELSHYISTPRQAGPYIPSAPLCPTEEGALERAIKFTLVDCYDEAVDSGCQPTDAWLVPNSTWSGCGPRRGSGDPETRDSLVELAEAVRQLAVRCGADRNRDVIEKTEDVKRRFKSSSAH